MFNLTVFNWFDFFLGTDTRRRRFIPSADTTTQLAITPIYLCACDAKLVLSLLKIWKHTSHDHTRRHLSPFCYRNQFSFRQKKHDECLRRSLTGRPSRRYHQLFWDFSYKFFSPPCLARFSIIKTKRKVIENEIKKKLYEIICLSWLRLWLKLRNFRWLLIGTKIAHAD